MPQISQRKLKQLLAHAESAKADIAEISGTLGEAVKDAVETHGLHRKAFRVCSQAWRMEPEKLAEFLECLDHYLEMSGLRDRAASAPRMAVDEGHEEAAAEDGESEEATEEENGGRQRRRRGNAVVQAFPRPSGEAAE